MQRTEVELIPHGVNSPTLPRRSTCGESTVFSGVMLGLIILLISGCASTPVRQAPWVVVNSPRFEILSSLSPEETKALATELERFHALVYALTSAPDAESPVPTRIYVFGRKSHYRDYAPRKTAGVFYEDVRANSIVLTDYSNSLGASEIILHEYTHFVLNNGATSGYPLWYNEGFAELLSSVRTHNDLVAVGALPEARRASFRYGRWIPIADIVAATGYDSVREDEVHMLYAESWALVHYLALDRPESGSFGSDLVQYMALVQSGTSQPTAFEEAFGESTKESGQNIRRVLGSKREFRVIGIPIKNIQYDRIEPSSRVATEAEVAIRLGQLQLMRGEGAAAEPEFRAALALEPDAPRALAGLGDALKFQDKWDAAEPYFFRAVELDPDDALNQLDLAEFLHDKALRTNSQAERQALLAHARRVYGRSREIEDGLPEAWLMEGRTYLAPRENPREGLPMLNKALSILPSSESVLMALAEARVALGQDRLAAGLITRAYSNELEGSPRQSTQTIIDGIKATRASADGRTTEDEGKTLVIDER